jgi:hypothetical protein
VAPTFPRFNTLLLLSFGSSKDKVYETNPHTVEELRNNVRYEISAISGEKLQRVNTNMFRRYCAHSVRKVAFSASSVALVNFYYTF